MRILAVLLVGLMFVNCSKDDPKPPEAVSLTFPEQNSECTTGVDVTETTSEVVFRWQTAKHTSTYELRVTHMITNVTQSTTTESTSAPLTIDKGAPYSWLVISRNSNTNESASSSTWQFYNAGAQSSYAPFPATIEAPSSGATVAIDANGEITLSWSGADVDNDLDGYDIYHGTTDPPTELELSTPAGTTEVKVSVDPGIYYWKVITKDDQGNTSDSGVYSYRAL